MLIGRLNYIAVFHRETEHTQQPIRGNNVKEITNRFLYLNTQIQTRGMLRDLIKA